MTIILILVIIFFISKPQSENPQTSSDRIYSVCLSDQRKENCYGKEFLAIAEKMGPKYSFETLAILQKKDPKAIGCHWIAHNIGSGTYKHNPSNWQYEIRNINPSCSYGAPHGVIESYIETLPGGVLTKDIVPEICGDKPRADCNHIIGHLILVETNADVEKALDICNVFKNDPEQLFHCNTGVFMEYQTAINLISHKLVPESWQNWPDRVPDLEKMCRSYKDERSVACWKEIAHAVIVKYKNDPTKVFAFCDRAPMAQSGYECKSHSVGIMSADYNFDYSKTKFICEAKQKDPTFPTHCYDQLVASTMSTIPQAREVSLKFCESLDTKYKNSCYSQIEYFDTNWKNIND